MRRWKRVIPGVIDGQSTEIVDFKLTEELFYDRRIVAADEMLIGVFLAQGDAICRITSASSSS